MSASRGLAIASAFRLADEAPVSIPRFRIEERDAEGHWSRFESAIETSRREINLLLDERNKEQSEILNAHLMMLSDPEFIPQIRVALTAKLFNIESVLKDKVDETAGLLRSTGDTYLAERAVDIEDAFGRVLGHLLEGSSGSRQSAQGRFISPGTILVARNIKPSEALSLKDAGLVGIALEEGGATSHVAILARSWKIPAVMGVHGLLDAVTEGAEIVLDATDGFVICDPSSDQLAAYRLRIQSDAREKEGHDADRARLANVRAETTDGAVMTLRANIAIADDAVAAKADGAEGVGLFRSEFLFLAEGGEPDEETQFEAYRAAVEKMDGAPVIIRTLDAGADKMVGEQSELAEKNPLLGWRAVRYCLDRRDLFKTQLRAMLRASNFGDLRIMFPMISNVEELDAVLDVLEESKAECVRDELKFSPALKVGIMVEIPAAAVCADLLAKKVDFMSIGTNDLTQYTMAVDRENPKVAHLFDWYNPAVLRLVKLTIEAGKKERVDVSMCGEMAGDPAAVFLLMGLGLRNFSMASSFIGPVKELVRKVSLADAIELSNAAMELSAAREIRKLVQERLKTYEEK